jgi:hypothetical protein
METVECFASIAEVRAHLRRLSMERLEAESTGLVECGPYMAQLAREVALCRAALVGAAVTEIAVLRAELSGPQAG